MAALARQAKTRNLIENKRRYLDALANDPSDIPRALGTVKRTDKWRRHWRSKDPDFKYSEDKILGRMEREAIPVPDFRTFRARYFGERGLTFPHMASWIDVYEDPAVRRAIIVGSPDTARSTVMDVQRYVHMSAIESYLVKSGVPLDKPMRAAVVSANGDLAGRFGWQIGQYLTDRMWSSDLITEYGPFRPSSQSKARWTDSEKYFAWRSPEEKDPSLQFLGWSESLQSARLTDLTLDDVDNPLSGPADRRKILRFLDQVALPRLDRDIGRAWYLCNRVDPADVAHELLARAEDGSWTAIVQSVFVSRCDRWHLQGHGSDSDPCEVCRSIWPERITLDSIRDARKQLRNNDRLFALVYLSEAHGEGTTFPKENLRRALDSQRVIGHVPDTARVICGLDPAAKGGAAVMAIGFDPSTRRRYLIDYEWGTGRGTPGLRQWITDYVYRFHPVAFGIEAQGGFNLLETDPEIKRFLEDEGVAFYPLETNRNKNDPEYGVTSMQSLFDPLETPALSIPWGDQATQAKMGIFLEQLENYVPGGIADDDAVIAMWLIERVIRQHSAFDRVAKRSTPDPLRRRRSLSRLR